MLIITDTIQRLSWEDHDRCTGKPWRHSQNRWQNNHKLAFCRWYRWVGKPRQNGGNSINSVWHGNQPRENKDHVKQSEWLTKIIKVKGYNLETVTNFKYLGAIMTDEGTKREVLTRTAQATSALTKLKTVWKDRKITSKHRIQILRSIVTSTLLYAHETWTLTAELERRIQTFEMRCYRKIFGISVRDRITNEDVRNRVRAAIGLHDGLLSTVKTRKLTWYGHVTRATGLANIIM